MLRYCIIVRRDAPTLTMLRYCIIVRRDAPPLRHHDRQ